MGDLILRIYSIYYCLSTSFLHSYIFHYSEFVKVLLLFTKLFCWWPLTSLLIMLLFFIFSISIYFPNISFYAWLLNHVTYLPNLSLIFLSPCILPNSAHVATYFVATPTFLSLLECIASLSYNSLVFLVLVFDATVWKDINNSIWLLIIIHLLSNVDWSAFLPLCNYLRSMLILW